MKDVGKDKKKEGNVERSRGHEYGKSGVFFEYFFPFFLFEKRGVRVNQIVL